MNDHNKNIDESAITERFIHSGGPGGQNVNKVATAVELRFDIDQSNLPGNVKVRLKSIARNRISDKGVLVVVSRKFRSQGRNRDEARRILKKLISGASTTPAIRKKTKIPSSAKRRRRENKRKVSEKKSLRKKPGLE